MRNSDFGMDLRCLTFTPFLKNRALSQSSLFSGGFSSGKTFPESKSSTNSFLRFPGLAAAVWDQKKLAKQRGRHTNVGQLHVILWEWISMKYWSSMWLCKGQQMMQLHDYLTISKKKKGGGRNETPRSLKVMKHRPIGQIITNPIHSSPKMSHKKSRIQTNKAVWDHFEWMKWSWTKSPRTQKTPKKYWK